jgi:hypothetical protein
MIPPKVAEQLFGKRISRTHAVIQVTIANRSHDQSLILKGVFIDYANWGLANCHVPPGTPNAPDPYQVATKPCQVSSAELRAVRQVALDGQVDYWRNRVSRYMHGIATIGGGLANLKMGPALPAAVAAFVGGPLPAFEFAFPDKTLNQINLLNDLGYSVNKVIPKDSSVVVMTFFPIERFLGPYLMQKFIETPSLLYSPQQYLLGETYKPFFKEIYAKFGPYKYSADQPSTTVTNQALEAIQERQDENDARQRKNDERQARNDQGKPGQPSVEKHDREPELLARLRRFNKVHDDLQKLTSDYCKADDLNPMHNPCFQFLLQDMTLDRVRIVADGSFVIDADNAAASITTVTADLSSACNKTEIDGVVVGLNLIKGEVQIEKAKELNITVTTIPDGSTDNRLKFHLKIDKPLQAHTLNFTVSKPQQDKDALVSNVFTKDFVLSDKPPQLDAVTLDKKSVTITGGNFCAILAGGSDADLVVKFSKDSKDVPVSKDKITSTFTQLTFDLPTDVTEGTWKVKVHGNFGDSSKDLTVPKTDK